jgi:MFS family permease
MNASIMKRNLMTGENFRIPVFFLLILGAYGAWQSLYNVYLDGIGFTSMQIGVLNAILISVSVLVIPFWGIMADRFGNNRVLLILTAACSVAVFLLGKVQLFHWMVFLIVIVSIFHQPGVVVDGMTSLFVREHPKYTFGQFRLWSSIGYGSASLAAGYLASRGTGIIFTFSAILFFLAALFNLLTMPRKPVKGRDLVNFRSFGIFFRVKGVPVFLTLIFIWGIASAPLMQFINLYYQDIGASESFIGWVVFLQAAPEIPAFLAVSLLIRRFGAHRIIILAMAVSVLRMLFYGMTHDPRVAIVFSVFHCITIAFYLVGVVEWIQDRTPDHLRTTGQALIWTFYLGGGVAVGNVALGYLRDAIGMNNAMFLHAALGLGITACTMLFFNPIRPAQRRKE